LQFSLRNAGFLIEQAPENHAPQHLNFNRVLIDNDPLHDCRLVKLLKQHPGFVTFALPLQSRCSWIEHHPQVALDN
jgi:hypothetical protein